MKNYTPTPKEHADWLKWVIERSGENPNGVLGEYWRMIAAVERAAAEKALTDAADALGSGWPDEIREWLRARAAALGLTAGQEGEKE